MTTITSITIIITTMKVKQKNTASAPTCTLPAVP